ncbi:MAG: PAS domain S-box protein [Desulfobacterales bacterium]|nr:PAS domain S-box protein [Desulfobacterales bacterium]MBF0395345.1 PAS domain S-box protein [Desulfobacterales bacterium]
MGDSLRVLIIEKSDKNVSSIIKELKKGKYNPIYERINNFKELKAALDWQIWDIIIADDNVESLEVEAALNILKERDIDIPFLIISDNPDEESAVSAIKAGSHDYIARKNISKLIFSVRGELERAKERKERRIAEEELRKSEEKYRVLAETAREIIIIIDLDGKINYVNRTGVVVGGFSEEEILSMNIADLLLAKRIAESQEFYLYEAEFINKSGEHIPVEVNSSLIDEGNKPSGILIVARDITEKKRAEKQAKLQQEQLFQADKMASLGTLVAGVAHEINNPISSIILNVPILQKIWESIIPILDEHCKTKGDFYIGNMKYSALQERLPMLLSDIMAGAKRVKTIVNDLKDFSRQAPSQLTDIVDINVSLKKSLRLVGNLIKKSTRYFSVNYFESIPTFIGNSQRIEQVIVNLLVNACEAIQNINQAIQASTIYDKISNCVLLEIKDEGIGISPDVIQRIKDPFFTTKRDYGGTGLGLSISDKIVKDHSGEISFISTQGQGTTVRLTIPIKSNAENIIEV